MCLLGGIQNRMDQAPLMQIKKKSIISQARTGITKMSLRGQKQIMEQLRYMHSGVKVKAHW